MTKEFPKTIPRSPVGGLKEYPVTKSEMLAYLKNNLSISATTYNDWYDEGVEITLCLDGEEISSSRVSIDTKCKNTHY
jgi:hypothetical protein